MVLYLKLWSNKNYCQQQEVLGTYSGKEVLLKIMQLQVGQTGTVEAGTKTLQ